jgi:hypothetical protein
MLSRFVRRYGTHWNFFMTLAVVQFVGLVLGEEQSILSLLRGGDLFD